MNDIVRRKLAKDVLIMLLLPIVIFGNISLLNVNAESNDNESGTIYDYNSDYYDSYEEFMGDDSAHFIYDESLTIHSNASDTAENVIVCSTVDDAAIYLRKCMVNRAEKVEFIFVNSEGFSGAEGFAAIKAATFVETDNPKEGDYLYWNYAGLEGSFDTVNEGMKYVLYPTYHSTLQEENEIDEKVAWLLNNEFKGWEAMSDFEIVKMVYSWITDNFTFVSGSDRHSTYSGIIEYQTVCQGFATTEYRLLREMGISCRVIANDSHGWNIVKIENYYYNIDATWDVGLNESGWINFLLANASFEKGTLHFRGERFNTDEFNKLYPMSDVDYSWTPEEPIVSVEYRTYVQTQGWQSWVKDGDVSGTEGQAKRLEAINIHLEHAAYLDIDVEYMTHIQSYGWETDWKSSDSISGTEGKSKRLEAIKIRLTGTDAEQFDIYYRVHVQSFGWLGWAKNGENAGTTGLSKRLEGIQIVVLPKGDMPEGTMGYSYIAYGKTGISDENKNPQVSYKTHIQTYGWQMSVSDGSISGTFGEGKRMEGINISLGGVEYNGGIEYRTHIQNYGWEQDWKCDGEMSGTEGQAKRLEAIQIKLYGEVAQHYDVYYRVHVQSYGWLDWVKNGEVAGTEGQGKRMEAIQIVVVPKK